MKRINILLLAIFLLSACSEAEKSSIEEDQVVVPEIVAPTYLSPKDLQDYISTAATVTPNTNCGEPFNTLVYDKVIAYDFDGRGESYSQVIGDYGFLRVIRKQVSLSQEQVNFATYLFSDTSTYGEVTAACFEPHLGIVFYQDELVVMQLNICLDCNYLRSSTHIPATQHVLVFKGEENEFAREGFSKDAVKGIISLSKELNLRYGDVSIESLLIHNQ